MSEMDQIMAMIRGNQGMQMGPRPAQVSDISNGGGQGQQQMPSPYGPSGGFGGGPIGNGGGGFTHSYGSPIQGGAGPGNMPTQGGGFGGQGGIMQALMRMLGGGQRGGFGQGMPMQQRGMGGGGMAYPGGSPTFNERTGYSGRPNVGINPAPMSQGVSLAQLGRPRDDMRIM